ncbi:MAG: PhoH family protein [Salibacteraceae bacterium]
MQELYIKVESANPVEIFGINNSHIHLLKTFFPKLQLIARGSTLKVMGEAEELQSFEKKFARLVEHFNKYNHLSETDIEHLMAVNGEPSENGESKTSDVLVFGTHGRQVRPRTPNQFEMVAKAKTCDLLFAIGPAGTGKTYTAVALAVQALKEKRIRRIILTRPAVEAGENLGFLPGDLKEKLDPYLQPLYDALQDMIPGDALAKYMEKGVIQIAPLAFMRGRTLDNAYVILDEAQNATESQMKMFLTRMGKSAKFIITGDMTQIDLPRNQRSGLVHALRLLKPISDIGIVMLDAQDVIRHKLVKKILSAYDKAEAEKESKSKKNPDA